VDPGIGRGTLPQAASLNSGLTRRLLVVYFLSTQVNVSRRRFKHRDLWWLAESSVQSNLRKSCVARLLQPAGRGHTLVLFMV
jgi:hypothetical protein